MLALHNLHVSFSEMKRIKQAIIEGRLWEHLEVRAHGHPSLLKALKTMGKYKDYLEKQSPLTKKSGLFFFNSLAQIRPEVVRHKERLLKRYSPKNVRVLVLMPQTRMKPFHKSWEYRRNLKEIMHKLGNEAHSAHVCVYAAPFGIIPIELDEVYPLSQHEITMPLDAETIDYIAKQIENYILLTDYRKVVLHQDEESWGKKILMACKKACQRKKVPLIVLKTKTKANVFSSHGASGV
jgi:7-cyano-7-deazaguanine tRNA-ribosyltransferase